MRSPAGSRRQVRGFVEQQAATAHRYDNGDDDERTTLKELVFRVLYFFRGFR